MRVRAAKYSAPLSGVKTVEDVDPQDATARFATDRPVEQNRSLVPDSAAVDAYGDDDIIDVDYDYVDDGNDDNPTLNPPQSHDEFSRDDRVARYQKMMSGYSNARFSARRSDDAILVRDLDGYRRKLLA